MISPAATRTGASGPGTGDQAPRRPSGAGPGAARLVLPGLVVALVLALAHFTWNGFFLYDDYIYLRQAQREGLSFKLLAQPLNLHFSPGHRFVDWVIQRWFPLNFGVAQVVLLVCFAASLVLLHRVLVELFGRGRGPLLLTLLYGTSIAHVGIVQWWASGLQSLPSTVLSLASILAYLQYRRTSRRGLLAASVLAFTAGLLFYIKPFLVPLYLVLLRVLVLDPEHSLRETLVATAREWRDWLAYLVPAGLYALVYLRWYWQPSGMASPRLLGRFLQVSWARVFMPSFVGFQVSAAPTSRGLGIAIALVQLGVAATVAWSLVRQPRAWRAWAFFVVVFVANGFAVGLARLGTFGTLVAYSYRYWLEATYLFPIAIGAAFLAFPPRRPAGGRRLAHRSAWRATAWALAGMAVASHVVLAWSSAGRVSSRWHGRLARAYVNKVETDLHRLAAVGVHPTILDGAVPEGIMPAWMTYGSRLAANRYSEFFRLIDPRLQFDRPSNALFRVAADGSLSSVSFVPESGGGATGLLRTGALAVTEGSVEADQRGLCVRSGAAAGYVQFTPPQPHRGDDGYVALTYGSDTAGFMTVALDRGAGYSYLDQRTVQMAKRGAGSVLSPLGGPAVVRVRLDLPPGSRVCLQTLEVGTIVASGARSETVGGRSPALDAFDRDDSSSTLGRTPAGARWLTPSGTWGVSAGQAYVAVPAAGHDIAVVGPAPRDGAVQVRLSRVSPLAGLVFRYRDPSDYWAVVAAPDYATWAIVRVEGGQETVVGNSGFVSTGDGTTVGARVRGADVTVLVDGRPTTTLTTGPPGDTDQVGMVATGSEANQARFDDFAILPGAS